MILYLDTSALVKQYLREVSSESVIHWVRSADFVGTSLITRTEAVAAFATAKRRRAVGETTAAKLSDMFRQYWPKYAHIPITETLAIAAGELAWQHGLRAYDAVHLASALSWQNQLRQSITFVTYDRQLWEAAVQSSLVVLPRDLENFNR